MPTPDSYIACRTYGHAWFEAPITGAWAQGWGSIGAPMTLRCERCTAERHDVINPTGDVIRRSYVHPPNYRYPKHEAPTVKDMRLALLALIRQNKRDDLARARANKQASRG